MSSSSSAQVYVTPSAQTLSALAQVSAILADAKLDITFTGTAVKHHLDRRARYFADRRCNVSVQVSATGTQAERIACSKLIEAREDALASIPGVRVFVIENGASFVSISPNTLRV